MQTASATTQSAYLARPENEEAKAGNWRAIWTHSANGDWCWIPFESPFARSENLLATAPSARYPDRLTDEHQTVLSCDLAYLCPTCRPGA